MHTYKNIWHKPNDIYTGPAMYSTDVNPTEYKGYLIYQRVFGHVWDIVKDGICISQMAGPNGAREAIDKLTANDTKTI